MKGCIAAFLAAAMLLSGCSGSIYSNYKETEQLLLVQALGVDGGEGEFTLSVSCAKPTESNSGTIISRSGESIVKAMNSLQDYSTGEQLYYAHAQYIVLGEDYAKGGIKAALDYVARDSDLRMGLSFFLVRGKSAKELITGPGEDSYDAGKTLAAVQRSAKEQGDSYVFTARETVRSLSESGAALVCAVKAADTEGSVFLLEPGIMAVPDGYAILKSDSLAGYLEKDLSAAATLILNKAGSFSMDLEDGFGGSVGLQIENCSAEISPRWAADGSLDSLEVSAELNAVVAEVDGDVNNITDGDFLLLMAGKLEKAMEEKMTAVLNISRELGADFLGMMAHLRQDNAQNADALGQDWLENAEFELKVKAHVNYTKELGDKMNTEGWGE